VVDLRSENVKWYYFVNFASNVVVLCYSLPSGLPIVSLPNHPLVPVTALASDEKLMDRLVLFAVRGGRGGAGTAGRSTETETPRRNAVRRVAAGHRPVRAPGKLPGKRRCDSDEARGDGARWGPFASGVLVRFVDTRLPSVSVEGTGSAAAATAAQVWGGAGRRRRRRDPWC
jgi:hypothetical protein